MLIMGEEDYVFKFPGIEDYILHKKWRGGEKEQGSEGFGGGEVSSMGSPVVVGQRLWGFNETSAKLYTVFGKSL
ncbi:hypothetical protein RHGRI_004618 [Rhododendron griersonianum]|uniref:Uncharacterized protein n=1 Tax=Rhododendron griersonianum TaxID=479676 RepID=A0AAV6L997_9ERIC|nr:hypothetical protein RHGRI_004607 [Rhododendron griersonianum]KAG5561620.1 hypothetical protein RHGRI_004618 [Rhododendron griersonianum]